MLSWLAPSLPFGEVGGASEGRGTQFRKLMKQKILFFSALLLFFSNIAFAQAPTLPAGVVLPDNIIAADCYTVPPTQEWKIREITTSSAGQYAVGQIPLVGDVDGDGQIEIITTNPNGNILYLLKSDGSVKKSFSITTDFGGYGGQQNAISTMGTVKWDNTTSKTILIVMQNTTRIMRAYDTDGTLLWTTTVPYHSESGIMGTASLVDLDGDGWAEIVVGSKVYAAESGILLCQAPASLSCGRAIYQAPMIHSLPMNVLDNSSQQICAGNTVYNVSITNRNSATGNTITPSVTLSSVTMHNGSSPQTLDGATYVVDFDLDGKLDIVVASLNTNTTNNTLYIYVWSPSKNEVIATKVIPYVAKKGNLLIGDVDGDRFPEIIFMHGRVAGNNYNATYDKITALKYDSTSATKEMEIFWQADHHDTSGCTGLTLFDFNQDGLDEIIYRDEDYLRIINGSKIDHLTGDPVSQPYDLASFRCGSNTWYEYPIVADIDQDGQAEIISIGPQSSFAGSGPVRIFKAGEGTKWAPARKVWNQYAYNVLNVNEDLTIPRYPMNPTTVFAGENETLGDSDDIRPFNNFLQQQTMLDQYGVPLWLIPNGEIIGVPTFFYNDVTDHLSTTIQVKNIGDAAFQDPFYLTIYKDNIGNPIKYVHKHEAVIAKDETVSITIGIANYYATFGAGKLVINLNDKGDGSMDQPACGTCSEESFFGFVQIEECIKNPKTLVNDISLPGTVTYQWQLSADAENWTDIAGETNSTYIVPNQKTGTSYYKVVVDNGSVRTDGALTKMIVYRCIMPVNPNIHIFQ